MNDLKSVFSKDNFTSRADVFKIEKKENFFEKYEILNVKELPFDEKIIFDNSGFHPIKRKEDNKILILTKSDSLRKDLSKLKEKSPLKLLNKYAKTSESIVVCDLNLYFEIIDQLSVINKEYSNDEAKVFFHDLLTDASRKKASDIHIAWVSDGVLIKYRLDGKMVKQPKKISRELGNALRNIFINRSGESEYQQNEVAGQITEIIDGVKMEYRVSIGPTIHGFVIVIRAESHINMDSSLEVWGYVPRAIEIIRRLFAYHHGIILVTGATGSGKSTMMYTCIIEKLNQSLKYAPEILTVEDPVEIVIDGVNQVQVNTKGDPENWITFSKAIKMFLRQDPDMIVVGEIRDQEVAIQAITAAKTGHLTVSTLHTNDVKSTFSRLNELGVDKANIEDGVKGIISQKLLNRLCNHCKIPYEKNGHTYYKRNTEGCLECKGSSSIGCKGRVPIVEIAELNNNPDNFKPENFEAYFSLEENIIYLIENGIIDEEEGQRYIIMGAGDDFGRRKEILHIWSEATKNKDEQNYIFPIYQPIIDDKDYIIGLESFMRIRNMKGDIISPKDFLKTIKDMNMYANFSMFMLDQLILVSKKMEKKIFWNIDDENIKNKQFKDIVLEKLVNADVRNKFVLEFPFKEEYKPFIEFCNKNKISIAIDHFEGNIKDIVFMERNDLVFDYIKTDANFVQGIHRKEKWIKDYIDIIKHYNSQIIVNFIETDGMLKEVKETYHDKIYGYQGYGIRRPDLISNYSNL